MVELSTTGKGGGEKKKEGCPYEKKTQDPFSFGEGEIGHI